MNDKWISVGAVISEDEYNIISSIARSNGWTLQGLLGPMLKEQIKELLVKEDEEAA